MPRIVKVLKLYLWIPLVGAGAPSQQSPNAFEVPADDGQRQIRVGTRLFLLPPLLLLLGLGRSGSLPHFRWEIARPKQNAA